MKVTSPVAREVRREPIVAAQCVELPLVLPARLARLDLQEPLQARSIHGRGVEAFHVALHELARPRLDLAGNRRFECVEQRAVFFAARQAGQHLVHARPEFLGA